jgi:hypothetical protein
MGRLDQRKDKTRIGKEVAHLISAERGRYSIF